VTSRTPQDLALGWQDALLNRDASSFGALFAADAVMIDVEHRTPDGKDPRVLSGRSEIAKVAEDWFASTPTFDYEVLEVLSDRRRAAVLWRYELETASFQGVTWLRCKAGEIVEALVYFDSYGLLHGSSGR
jgi:hypothetical protein